MFVDCSYIFLPPLSTYYYIKQECVGSLIATPCPLIFRRSTGTSESAQACAQRRNIEVAL